MACRVRIDRLLVERGLFTSRAKAQTAIAAGRVTADDVVVASRRRKFPRMQCCAPSRRTLTYRAAG